MSSGDDLFYISLKMYFNKQLPSGDLRRHDAHMRLTWVIFELAWDLLISNLSLEVC